MINYINTVRNLTMRYIYIYINSDHLYTFAFFKKIFKKKETRFTNIYGYAKRKPRPAISTILITPDISLLSIFWDYKMPVCELTHWIRVDE